MKRVFSIVLLLFLIAANAQFRTKNKQQNRVQSDEQPFSWGFYLGTNIFDYKLHPNENGLNDNELFLVETDPKMGFHAGFIGKMKLNNYFDFKLEPGIYFLSRDITFHNVAPFIGTVTPEGNTITKDNMTLQVKSTYLDVPMFIHLHGNRWQNTRPFMQAGVSWMINLQSEEKNEQDSYDGVLRTTTNNFTWQFELGTDIYFKRFKLTPALKGIFFFNNEWRPDNPGTPDYWAGALTSLSSRAFVFSLKFE